MASNLRPVITGSDGPLIFLIAGEPSGDQLGARLMKSLQDKTQGQVRFAGIGGELMRAQGLQSLFPISELAVMGLVEVTPHIRHIYGRVKDTVAVAEALKPAALVTIDAPNFSLAVSKRLTDHGFPLIHYVAPSVWAWKPGRAKKIAGFLDHLLALLPFEPPYFESHGLTTTFVGHPAVEAKVEPEAGRILRQRLEIEETAPLLCVLPGSRKGEVRRLAPIFGEALDRVGKLHPDVRVLVPTMESVEALVQELVADWPIRANVLTGQSDKFAAFDVADVGLAASGTVALELAVAGLPSVIAYRVNSLTALMVRHFLKVDFASIVNLIEDREIQPEYIQKNCTAPKLAAALNDLLSDPIARQAQIDACSRVAKTLGKGDFAPSDRAADAILALIESRAGAGHSRA